MEDYYTILGVHPSSTAEDIKKAYRQLALKWHPDKNPENKEEASQKFKQIAEAYQILGNRESRQIYDLRLSSAEESSISDGVFHDGFNPTHIFEFHFRDPTEIFRQFFDSDDDDFDEDDDDDDDDDGNHIFLEDSLAPLMELVTEFDSALDEQYPGWPEYYGSSSHSYHGHYQPRMYYPSSSSSVQHNHHHHHLHHHHQPHPGFSHSSYPCIPGPGCSCHRKCHRRSQQTDDCDPSSSCFTSATTTFINGVKVTTRRRIEHGIETTAIYENDVLKSKITRNLNNSN